MMSDPPWSSYLMLIIFQRTYKYHQIGDEVFNKQILEDMVQFIEVGYLFISFEVAGRSGLC
jgi:hypothetical protein